MVAAAEMGMARRVMGFIALVLEFGLDGRYGVGCGGYRLGTDMVEWFIPDSKSWMRN